MNILRIKLEKSVLREHYQYGMLKLFEVPVNHGHYIKGDTEFFAYISTLGGGLVDKESYKQNFKLIDSKAVINSQANQKIYKGNSSVETKIELDNNSCFVFHNDANIFYPNSNFISENAIFAKKQSKLFVVDGGFVGYADGDFSAKLSLKLFIDYKLALYDNFCYHSRDNLNALYRHDYFYTLVIRGAPEINSIQEKDIKAHASTIDETTIVRILSNDNGLAIDYINSIKNSFLQQEGMTLKSTR